MKKIIYTALLLLVTVSCDKWFEAEPKGGGQSGAKVFDNEASFRDYMNGIYTGLRSAELYGSNLTLGGVEFLAQSFVPDEGAEAWTKLDFSSEMGQNVSREAYAKLYAAIYQCNDILELFAEKKDVDFIAGSREMMVAEARGLRAFLHFELLRLYSPAYAADNAASNILWVEGTQPEGVRMTTAQLTDKIIAELEAGELEALRKLKDWDFQTEQRMMLDVTVQREGRQIYTNLGLNDAVIREGPISHVIHLKISSDGRHLADIAGDGVIVATPTGSTAYSLSAGGPVVEPVAQTMVVCPICTHNMRFSSYVLSPEHTLTIELERNGRKPVYLFVDESRAFSLKADDKIQVRRSKHTVRLVRLSERSFCEIFAQKMLPGGFEDEK